MKLCWISQVFHGLQFRDELHSKNNTRLVILQDFAAGMVTISYYPLLTHTHTHYQDMKLYTATTKRQHHKLIVPQFNQTSCEKSAINHPSKSPQIPEIPNQTGQHTQPWTDQFYTHTAALNGPNQPALLPREREHNSWLSKPTCPPTQREGAQ